MWQYPELNPIALSIGPIAIHWYALSYLLGIGFVWWHLSHKSKLAVQLSTPQFAYTQEQISDLAFYAVLGVILGGRIGYMLFYGWEQLLDNPLNLLKVWQGGMSFHGGMIGVCLGVVFFCRMSGRSFFQVTDFLAPSVPFALGCGRIGNFINGELPGRTTQVAWAVIYPGDIQGRHPSSLYQALLEGVVLFALLWLFSRKPRPVMAVSAVFLLGYGSLRVFSECFRAPDIQLGFMAFNHLTQGQLLSIPMLLIGAGILLYSYRANGLRPVPHNSKKS